MAKLLTPRTYDYEGWNALLGNKAGMKIGNNTYAERCVNTDAISIRLHYTQIVVLYADGKIKLNSGGFRTVTTKDRLNAVLPQALRVVQKNFEWFLVDRGVNIDFFDGMVIETSSVNA